MTRTTAFLLGVGVGVAYFGLMLWVYSLPWVPIFDVWE